MGRRLRDVCTCRGRPHSAVNFAGGDETLINFRFPILKLEPPHVGCYIVESQP